MKTRTHKPASTCRKQSAFNASILLLFILISSKAVLGQELTLTPVSPLQTGHYMPGFMNIRDMADPAPASGLMILDYSTYQYGDKYYDAAGNKVSEVAGPEGTVDLNSDLNGYINSPMVIYAHKKKILGATYYAGISIPVLTVNTNLAYERLGTISGREQSGDVSGQVSGISDLNVMPFYLSWAKPAFNITAGYMFYAPTGEFELGGSDNTGLGYWSNVFQAFGYWYPEKSKGKASQALAVMLGASYEVTGEIKQSDVNPGNRFSIDYGIEQYLTDDFSLGIYGGNNWQISEDEGEQVYWDAGVKDRLGVAGVQVAYWLWESRLQAVAKWGFSYGAIERYQQNTAAINLIFMTNVLTGNKRTKAAGTN